MEVLLNSYPTLGYDPSLVSEEIVFGNADNTDTKKEIDSAATMQDNRTAILLVDFQNEFAKKGGKLYDVVSATMEETGLLQNAPKLVEFARQMEAMIIYSPVVMAGSQHFDSSKKNDSCQAFEEVEYSKQKQFGLFTENTWNCEIIRDVEPKNDDIVLRDRSDFSAFAGTKLQSILKSNDINHLFIMGFLTDVCVYQTSKDAARLMPDIVTYVVADACATKCIDDHNNALEKILEEHVNVLSCSEAESVLRKCATRIKNSNFDGNDTWLLIEKIFSFAGVGENDEISADVLQSLIGSMPTSSSILTILSDCLRCNENTSISREFMHEILFERKPRSGCFEKLPIFIIVGLLPTLYSISTRLPFIFLALEITVERKGELWEVGLVLGVYQTSRALGNLIIVVFGGFDPFKRLEIFQILLGLFGWLFLAFYQRDNEQSLFPFGSNSSSDVELLVWPLFALFFVGLCETVVNLQRSLMIETSKESPSGNIDEEVVAKRLGIQYAFVACGSVIAFVGGGMVYTNFGYTAVCEVGTLVQIMQLVAAATYLALSKNGERNLQTDELDGNDLVRTVIYQFQAASVISKYSRDVKRGTEYALNSEFSGLSAAVGQAKSDRVLTHSLRGMFQFFFTKERDDIASMEALLNSIDKAGTGINSRTGINSLASKRPSAMAIGKLKLSKLVLFLMKTKGEGSLTESQFVSFWAPIVYQSMYGTSQAARISVVWPYMIAVVLTQSIAALCIGTFLSTALLSYNKRFKMEAAQVGHLLGIGEGLGMITILLKSYTSSRANARKKSYKSSRFSIMKLILARPLNVPFILFVASTASMMFSINNYTVAVMSQMILSSVNDLSVSLMNELVGTSLPAEKFRYYQGLGQWMRRLGNMVTGFLGPILFGISMSFPFVFFGLIVFVWAFCLWFFMYLHAKRIEQSTASNSIDDDNEKYENKSWFIQSVFGKPYAPFIETCRTPWHVLEQRYYTLNKERIEEELKPWEKASIDISVLEHRIRRIAAALEVEKDQRRALEDRIYARVPIFEHVKATSV